MKIQPLQPNLDRKSIVVVPLEQADSEKQYWLAQNSEERLRHLLYLRQMNYGDEASRRLSRVLEVVVRASD